MDALATFGWTLLGVLAGGVITLLVSRKYYIKASEDLEENYRKASSHLDDKVKDLQNLIGFLAIYLERDGVIDKLEYDENGNLKPFTQTIHAGSISSQAKVPPPTVTLGNPPEDPEGTGEARDPKT